MSVAVPAKAGSGAALRCCVQRSDRRRRQGRRRPELDRRKIEIPGHIKTTGAYAASVRLHPEVSAKVAFEVVPA